jgi:hypothetical protein
MPCYRVTFHNRRTRCVSKKALGLKCFMYLFALDVPFKWDTVTWYLTALNSVCLFRNSNMRTSPQGQKYAEVSKLTGYVDHYKLYFGGLSFEYGSSSRACCSAPLSGLLKIFRIHTLTKVRHSPTKLFIYLDKDIYCISKTWRIIFVLISAQNAV